MSKIDKYNAPRGCIAVTPDKFFHDGIGECFGCCFDSGDDRGCMLDLQHDYVSTPCWAEGRKDKQDVIFKREGSSGEGDATTQRSSEDTTPPLITTRSSLPCHRNSPRSDDLCSR